jgi:hypothetical protein
MNERKPNFSSLLSFATVEIEAISLADAIAPKQQTTRQAEDRRMNIEPPLSCEYTILRDEHR